jgi:hypothetical protein
VTGQAADAPTREYIQPVPDLTGRCEAGNQLYLAKGQVMPSTTIQYFSYAHLPEQLQRISKPIHDLAHLMEEELPDGPEKSAGMRKLLEAKDCFVRANIVTKE